MRFSVLGSYVSSSRMAQTLFSVAIPSRAQNAPGPSLTVEPDRSRCGPHTTVRFPCVALPAIATGPPSSSPRSERVPIGTPLPAPHFRLYTPPPPPPPDADL